MYRMLIFPPDHLCIDSSASAGSLNTRISSRPGYDIIVMSDSVDDEEPLRKYSNLSQVWGAVNNGVINVKSLSWIEFCFRLTFFSFQVYTLAEDTALKTLLSDWWIIKSGSR